MRWKICGVLALSLSLGLSACQALEAGLVREETWQRVVLEDGEEAAEETAGADESGEEAGGGSATPGGESVQSGDFYDRQLRPETREICRTYFKAGDYRRQMTIVPGGRQDRNRVTVNRSEGKATRYYVDEFHLLLRGEVGSWSVEIWKRFRKWGGIPTGITQNIKDLLASPEIENIFENSDFIYLLNQASGDRKILCERLNISTQQAAHISNAGPGEGLIFFGNVILPFADHFPQDNELYSIMTTRPGEAAAEAEEGGHDGK